MILYNVTVSVDKEVEKEWLEWMRNTHIPDVLKTGFFVENKIFRLLGEVENDGMTYSIQYFAKSINDINQYLEECAPKLMKEHSDKYKDRHVAFRTVLESVD